MRVTAKIREFVWEYLQPLLGTKKNSEILNKNTSSYFLMHCLFCDRLLCYNEAILASYPLLGLLLQREGPSLGSSKPTNG